jgi:hypothetical protein
LIRYHVAVADEDEHNIVFLLLSQRWQGATPNRADHGEVEGTHFLGFIRSIPKLGN